MNNKLQKISIILPTLNEAKNLKILIPQIMEELDTYKEMIVAERLAIY